MMNSWTYGGSSYRIIRRSRRERERGYAGMSEEHYNVLQVRVRITSLVSIFLNMSRWRDVEEEHIPSFAWIDNATLGFTDWKSELFEKCRQQLAMPIIDLTFAVEFTKFNKFFVNVSCHS